MDQLWFWIAFNAFVLAIIYSSIVFAILGLRAMYFLLADVILRLAADFYKVPTLWPLGVIALVLLSATATSLVWPRRPQR